MDADAEATDQVPASESAGSDMSEGTSEGQRLRGFFLGLVTSLVAVAAMAQAVASGLWAGNGAELLFSAISAVAALSTLFPILTTAVARRTRGKSIDSREDGSPETTPRQGQRLRRYRRSAEPNPRPTPQTDQPGFPWLPLVIAFVSGLFAVATAAVSRSSGPPDCLAYADRLMELDDRYSPDQLRAFSEAFSFTRYEDECGHAGEVYQRIYDGVFSSAP